MKTAMEAKLVPSQARSLRSALDDLGAKDVVIDDTQVGRGTLTRLIGNDPVLVGAFYRFEGAWTVSLGAKPDGGFRGSLVGRRREPPGDVLRRLAPKVPQPFDAPRRDGNEMTRLLSAKLAALTDAPSDGGFAWSSLVAVDAAAPRDVAVVPDVSSDALVAIDAGGERTETTRTVTVRHRELST